MAIARENFFWHKLHSLTGIVPVGYYMVQHLALNSFSLGGPAYFDGIIHFFEGMPKHFLIALKVLAIWIPLIFHAVYGLFIVSRAQPNLGAYRWRENRLYTWQRVSGIAAFVFLAYHMASTSVAGQIRGPEVIRYAAMQQTLTATVLGVPYLVFAVYLLGILACTYHLSYGIWNFCIRWGITVSERAQMAVQKFAAFSFFALTVLGWSALAGFLIHDASASASSATVQTGMGRTVSR